MTKGMGLKSVFKKVVAEKQEKPEISEAERVQEFADWLDKKLADSVDSYMGIIAQYDPNSVTVFKRVLAKLNAGVVNVEEIWDEEDYVGSILKFYNKYSRLISRLPSNIAVEISGKLDTWTSRFFNQL